MDALMSWVPRPLRRFIRGGRSTLTVILCAALCLLLITLIATSQLSASANRELNDHKFPPEGARFPHAQRPQNLPAPDKAWKQHSNNKYSGDEDALRNRVPHDGGGGVQPLPKPLQPESWERNILNRGGNAVPDQAFALPQAAADMKDYPILTPDGKFVPTRRWVHLDLKGAPYKPTFFFELFAFFRRINLNGVLIEWEDMFPYTGTLASAVNGNAYTLEQVDAILDAAKEMQLEVTPLIQTFGHLEWVLKLEAFAHLREDPRFPQVICFGANESWALLADMVDQVARVHANKGMRFFHMGADEAFQIGVCNATLTHMHREGGRERVVLWHMARTASYIKHTYGVTVLGWHDMLAHSTVEDLHAYGITKVMQPVLWSYAEDLEEYLPYANWEALKPFGSVWASSAFKGADGPHRFDSNPIHYLRNHESWITQMTRAYKDFKVLQGLIITGWSRYDHMAVLAELMPVSLPTLVMCVETILAGRPLNGMYPKTKDVLHCSPPSVPGYARGCNFPASRIYELVNEYSAMRAQIRHYAEKDHERNGWLSNVAQKYQFASSMYLDKIMPFIDYYLTPLERLERDLRQELARIYFPDAVDEFVLTYMSEDLRLLRDSYKAAEQLSKVKTFPKRPFVVHPPEKETTRRQLPIGFN